MTVKENNTFKIDTWIVLGLFSKDELIKAFEARNLDIAIITEAKKGFLMNKRA